VIVGGRGANGEKLEIFVKDDGPGIPVRLANGLERFYRVDKAFPWARRHWIGLAIVKHIVQAHGGRVWVEANPAKGRFSSPCRGRLVDAVRMAHATKSVRLALKLGGFV
jgi:signal transduction histidine kinase